MMHINSKQPFAILVMIEFCEIKRTAFQVVRTRQAFRYHVLHLIVISNRELWNSGLLLIVIHLHEVFSDSIRIEGHMECIMRLQQLIPCLKQLIYL